MLYDPRARGSTPNCAPTGMLLTLSAHPATALLIRNVTTECNIYWVLDRISFITNVVKSTGLTGVRKRSPHFFTERASEIILRYILYLRPLELRWMTMAPFFTADSNVSAEDGNYLLFSTLGFSFTTEQFTSMLRKLTKNGLNLEGNGYVLREMRQLMIFIGENYIKQDATFDKIQEILDHQAGHNSITARREYGRSAEAQPWLVGPGALPRNKGVCELHHGFFLLKGAEKDGLQYLDEVASIAKMAELHSENEMLRKQIKTLQMEQEQSAATGMKKFNMFKGLTLQALESWGGKEGKAMAAELRKGNEATPP